MFGSGREVGTRKLRYGHDGVASQAHTEVLESTRHKLSSEALGYSARWAPGPEGCISDHLELAPEKHKGSRMDIDEPPRVPVGKFDSGIASVLTACGLSRGKRGRKGEL